MTKAFSKRNRQEKKKFITLTVNAFVKEMNELLNSSKHLLPGQIQQGDDSEAKLPQEVAELMNIHDRCHQGRVVGVIQVANK